jgi:hypothetical protein
MRKELKEVTNVYRRLWQTTPEPDANASDFDLAAWCLQHNMTFRLPASASFDRMIGFRAWWRAMRRLRSRRPATTSYARRTGMMILNSNARNQELIREYIERSSGELTEVFVHKDECGSVGKAWPVIALSLFPFALSTAFRCIFSADRANRAQSIVEVVEITWILNLCRRLGITRIYDFIPYEKDGNTLTIFSRERGISIIKVPSSGPLLTHNRILIGDEIVLSSAYHHEELKVFGGTIRAPRFLHWPPERAHTYIHNYLNRPAAPARTVAYYSHAEWVRKAEGHGSHGLDVSLTEERILHDLNLVLKSRPDIRLLVFLHPREKHPAWLERSVAYYNQRLPDARIEFAPFDAPTPQAFHFADVAVVSYSSVIFERLFCGYKLLIGNYSIPSFPIPGSPLHHIVFRTSEELYVMLTKALSQTAEEFYQRNGLMDYPYTSHPDLQEILMRGK